METDRGTGGSVSDMVPAMGALPGVSHTMLSCATGNGTLKLVGARKNGALGKQSTIGQGTPGHPRLP